MLFKLSLLFRNGQWNFLSWQKNLGHFWTLFRSKIWPFSLKNQVFGHFLRNHTSDLSKTWSETGDSCFQSSNDSVVPGKFLFWPFCSFFGQKYIACGDIIWFWAVFGHFFQTVDDFSLIFFIYAKFYCLKMVNEIFLQTLKMVNENFCSDKKIGPFFTLFWSKIWTFSFKNQVFGHFLQN